MCLVSLIFGLQSKKCSVCGFCTGVISRNTGLANKLYAIAKFTSPSNA